MIVDMIPVVPLVGAASNLLLAAGSYAIAAALGQPPGRPRWLAAAVLFWSCGTVGLELLGAFGAIGALSILGWSGLVAAAGLIAWRGRRGALEFGPKPEFDPKPGNSRWPVEPEATISLALVLSACLLYAIPSLIAAVKVVSDGPIYHLYFAARWWKAGRLILVAAPFGENAATYFPANGDLWFTWLMASCGGDRLARIGQAPFLLLAGVSALGCARQLGIGRSAATIAACWFVTSTPLLLFSAEPNVDTIFVAGYLMVAYFFLRYALADGGTPALALGALAAGGALGTKAVALVFVPPLIAVIAVAIACQRLPPRMRLLRIIVVATLPLVTGGYWYARNAAITGNPLYPLNVTVLGRTLLAGWYGSTAMATSPYYLPPGEWRALGDIILALLDPRLAPVWLAALAGAWAPRNPRTVLVRRWIALFAIGAVVNAALYWLLIPYRTQQRFVLHALGLAVVPLAATFDRARWLRLLAAGLLALHLMTPETWPVAKREIQIPWDLSPMVPNIVGSLMVVFPKIEPYYNPTRPPTAVRPELFLVAILMVAAWRRGLGTSAWRAALAWGSAAVLLAMVFVVIGCLSIDPGYFDPKLRFFPPFREYIAGWKAFEPYGSRHGVRVAYSGTNLPYYLLGPGLRNDVRYVNIDAHRDWLLHDYHRDSRARGEGLWPNSRPGWDRIHPDERAWLDNLEAEGIQFLVVTKANPAEGPHNVADADGFPIERRWADSLPGRFIPLYGAREHDPWFRLYRVVRAPGLSEREF
ncbi:MAG: glycosyltransferase family 39 protein [Isosphaeraceae bacterium]